MKCKFSLVPAIVWLVSLVVITGIKTANAHPNGAPPGYTGSPFDNKNCTFCHGGSASTVTGWITSNIPAQGYTPGQSYTITCTSTGTGNKGFEISPHNLSGTLLGTITPGTGSKITGSNYLTHTAPITGSSATWNWTWTAPAAGTGSVTFYCAFVVTKPVIKLCTMTVGEFIPLNVTVTATPPVICLGSSSQLNASATGGAGTYTYSWTSIPAGFNSTLQNPTVTPDITTKYIVHTSDGSLTRDDTTQVTIVTPASVFAGNDTIYPAYWVQFPVAGAASNYQSVQWTTSGTGNFSAPTSLTGFYLPSDADRTAGSVNLTLTAHPVSPCQNPAVSVQHVSFSSVGINEEENLLTFRISPNPAPGFFAIHFTRKFNETVTVSLSNIHGVEQMHFSGLASELQDMPLNISAVPKGVCLIKVQSRTLVKVAKVVVE